MWPGSHCLQDEIEVPPRGPKHMSSLMFHPPQPFRVPQASECAL